MDVPEHANASCSGWPQCTNASNVACGCFNYGWDAVSFAAFVDILLEENVSTISVWRGDITPPESTSAVWPEWFVESLRRFLAA